MPISPKDKNIMKLKPTLTIVFLTAMLLIPLSFAGTLNIGSWDGIMNVQPKSFQRHTLNPNDLWIAAYPRDCTISMNGNYSIKQVGKQPDEAISMSQIDQSVIKIPIPLNLIIENVSITGVNVNCKNEPKHPPYVSIYNNQNLSLGKYEVSRTAAKLNYSVSYTENPKITASNIRQVVNQSLGLEGADLDKGLVKVTIGPCRGTSTCILEDNEIGKLEVINTKGAESHQVVNQNSEYRFTAKKVGVLRATATLTISIK